MISEDIQGRSDVQCLHRWQKVLDPGLRKGAWTDEEDAKLRVLVAEHGTKKWAELSQDLPGRIGKQCRERCTPRTHISILWLLLPPRWLACLITRHDHPRCWCQKLDRWHNHLNPDVKKDGWTEEEDSLIIQAQSNIGNKWAEISKLLPGRSDKSRLIQPV